MFIVKLCLLAWLLDVLPSAHALCPKDTITVGILNLPPYTDVIDMEYGIISKHFKKSIDACFNQSLQVKFEEIDNPDDLFNWLRDAKVHFGFPVTEDTEFSLNYEYTAKVTYFDVVFSPGYAVISDIGVYNSRARALVVNLLLKEWPIFAFTFLLAGIAGVIIWAGESRANPEEFPASFIRGWYEGMWWAVVTMTTVGYGDKSPRTLCGRLFAILWVFVGLVLISILTAIASSVLEMTGTYNALHGMKVAVPDDDTGTSEKAVDIGMHPINMYSFHDMYNALKEHRVQGIFIDVYQARYHMNEIPDEQMQLRIFRQIDLMLNYKIASTVSKDCPIMKQCLTKKLDNPSVQMFKKKLIPSAKLFNPAKDSQNLFSGDSDSTKMVLWILTGIFAALILLGAAGEMAYKHFARKTTSSAVGVGGDGNRLFTLVSPSGAKQLHEIEESLENLTRHLQQVREQLAAAGQSGNAARTNQSSN